MDNKITKKEQLKIRRLRLGYSQRDLSIKSGISYRTLQDYEQGHKSLSLARADVVFRLSKALNCSMEDLIAESTITDNTSTSDRLLLYHSSFTPEEQIGSVNISIDEIVPCLRNTETGDEEDTVVFRIMSHSYLKRFNSKNGWYINWSKLPADVEVYALALKSTNDIQGLIGLRNDTDADAVYIHWACAAPHNNVNISGEQKYTGVGGHLFAIAADISNQYSHDGYVYGHAANETLLNHYITIFNAEHIPQNHIYQFVINELNAAKLLEVYNYEWNNS